MQRLVHSLYRSMLIRVIGSVVAAVGASAACHAAASEAAAESEAAEAVESYGIAPIAVGAGPYFFDTAEQHVIRVDVVARKLAHPFSLAFLPNGDALIVERGAALRLLRGATTPQAQLVKAPIGGIPNYSGQAGIAADDLAGIQDVAVHPKFSANHFVYFTYNRPVAPQSKTKRFAFVLARARLENAQLVNVQELLVGEPKPDSGGSRIAFGKADTIYATTGAALDEIADWAQRTDNIYGKVLRVRDDGSIPTDNPFARTQGARGEIYSLGHRDSSGLAIHPQSGSVVSSEYGPQGGDKLNLILPGRNYGWPQYSFGRDYDGARRWPVALGPKTEPPMVLWIPSISPSGIAFYTADRMPAWKGNLFAAGARRGEIDQTGTLERIVLNEKLQEVRRESLLGELHQRMRDVRQGPDGLLYVLTDEDDGVLLRISPSSPRK